MHVKPPPGQSYRDPVTLQLVPSTGFTADPLNLDHARAIACGDLVKCSHAKKPAAASTPQE